MQLLFFGVVVLAPPRHHYCSFLLLDIIPSPLRHHYCFLMVLLLLLFVNIVLTPLWHCFSSCSSLMLFMFLLDIAPPLAPPQHQCRSSTAFLLLLFLDMILTPLQHHSYFFFLTSLLLILFFNTSPSPPWCHSYSSYCKYLFIPPQRCCFSSQHYCHSSCFKLVFPPSCFYRCRRSKPSKFVTHPQLLEGLKCESKWKTAEEGGVGMCSLAHNTWRGRGAC